MIFDQLSCDQKFVEILDFDRLNNDQTAVESS